MLTADTTSPLRYVRFDVDYHSCDHCGRTLKDGAVVLSDDRRVGRDCAATLLGKPRADRTLTEAFDALETAALRARWDATLEGSGKWRSMRFLVAGRPESEGGDGRAFVSPYLALMGTTWEAYTLADGRIVATAPRVIYGKKANTRRPEVAPLCAGPMGVRYYDLTPYAADIRAMEAK